MTTPAERTPPLVGSKKFFNGNDFLRLLSRPTWQKNRCFHAEGCLCAAAMLQLEALDYSLLASDDNRGGSNWTMPLGKGHLPPKGGYLRRPRNTTTHHILSASGTIATSPCNHRRQVGLRPTSAPFYATMPGRRSGFRTLVPLPSIPAYQRFLASARA